jgi:phosphate-selective porin OprO/OprP
VSRPDDVRYTRARVPLSPRSAGLAVLVLPVLLSSAHAQPVAPPPVTLTGYVQTQYERFELAEAARDRAIFRRLIVGLQAAIAGDWSATILIDFAGAVTGDRVKARDVYLRYTGLSTKGLTITVGNQKVPFSRSVLTSSRSRSFIERPFTGERAFGAIGRAIAAEVDGSHLAQRVQWSGAVASVLHAPDARELRLDGIADAEDTWNEGVMAVGRVEWHLRGPVARAQGDFTGGPFRVMTGAAAYVWKNDGDRNLFTRDGASSSTSFADLDTTRAVELDAAIRGHRLALDGSWSRVVASTVDPAFTGGLYLGGRTALHQTALEAGYMVVPHRVEILGGIDSLAITGRPSIAYRPTLGTTWYVNGQLLKFSVMHRESVNTLGARGVRARATYVQAQFAF